MDAVINIRDAQEKDAAQLANLLHALFSIEADFKPDMEKQKAGLSLLISQPEHGVIKAAFTEDGKLIGMVSAQLVISTAQGALSAWVEDMIVHAEFRQQGIGRKLLQSALDWAKEKGATRAQLLVDIENEPAIGYYRHLGWESTQLNARRLFL